MTPRYAFDETMVAMERLAQVFQEEIERQRAQGRDEEVVSRLFKGANAMRDAAGIYLAWAQHYISALDHPGEEGEQCFDPDGEGAHV